MQQRLRAIDLLSQADFQAEMVAQNAASVAESAIPNTILAIGRLHREVAGTNLWVIRPGSREQEALNNPPRFRTQAMEFTHAVGQGQHNAPADVRLLQDRLLNLGYLAQSHFDGEAVDPGNAANPPRIADAEIPQTIAALTAMQTASGLGGAARLFWGAKHTACYTPGPADCQDGDPARHGGGGRWWAYERQPACGCAHGAGAPA